MRPFEVFRDGLGVPHVRAQGELDLAFGQGYVTARDRGWQVEVDRWRAEGRLAARFGSGGLEWDRFAVRVRLADTARRVWDALEGPERDWVAAFAAGVSAGLDAGGRDVPELRALERACAGAPLPPHEPWPDWAPIGVFLVNHVLFSGFPHLLWREHVARTLSPDPSVAALFAADGGPASGSNAWALAGSRTASGRPLLAGDPHRFLELPGVYQQVRLACDEYDVLGLAFPGVPGVLHFGHAQVPDDGGPGGGGSVAWGITNAMAHHVELVREDAASVAAAATGTERVPVRGAAPVDVTWGETARGPLVTDEHALCWPVRVTADAGVAAWRRLQRARTAHDVAAAFAAWVDPVNRVLTADSSGEVLSLTAGRVPEREAGERVVPLPAEAAPPRWRSLPPPVRVTDVAVDANERPARAEIALGYAYAPHRADRIRALLAAPPAGGETPESQGRVHGDVQDAGAAALVGWLDGVVPGAAAPPVAGAAERLRAWAAAGAPMHAGSTDAGLFARWRHALVRRVAAHPALAPLHAPHGLPAVFAPWLDVTARVGEGLARLLGAGRLVADGPVLDGRAEAAAALTEVVAEGAELSWGELHAVAPLHALADATGVAHDDVPGVPEQLRAPLSGAGDTVRCTGSVPGVTHLAARGSVARWVWDLSDRRRSRWGVPFGASGDPRSPRFADQHPTWAAAGTAPIETDWARLRPEPVEGPA
ncbi:penicillin acylase family protein [Isoptericola variabilis]|uniref:Peptidase S45 penicillin amidase n=1 Tax=Isoptericola variabilis (strain 225) TaxID=743718 RepID=F6FVD9_ISOV2|nr:penicillin acylase family protein [Isoptericola variabilis]AEG43412.1 peptidase S45 penicillin amidase [Isoptericola variabilis 225]TWH34531.1 penicillin amidase [Isoptericola variabilis J7]